VPRRRKKGNRGIAGDATDVPLSRLLRVKKKKERKEEKEGNSRSAIDLARSGRTSLYEEDNQKCYERVTFVLVVSNRTIF